MVKIQLEDKNVAKALCTYQRLQINQLGLNKKKNITAKQIKQINQLINGQEINYTVDSYNRQTCANLNTNKTRDGQTQTNSTYT